MYELLNEGEKVEPCPRHVCPFAIVAFSYGKTAISLELKEKRSASFIVLLKWCLKRMQNARLASDGVGHWFYSLTENLSVCVSVCARTYYEENG